MKACEGSYKYTGKNFTYSCEETADQVIVTVKKKFFIFTGWDTEKNCFIAKTELEKNEIIEKYKPTHYLPFLRCANYVPKYKRSLQKCCFIKNPSYGVLGLNRAVRLTFNIQYLFASALKNHGLFAKKAKFYLLEKPLELMVSQGPKQAASPLPSPGPSTSPSPPTPTHSLFPKDSLAVVLKLMEDVEVDKLLQELHERVEKNETTFVTSLMQYFNCAIDSPLHKFLSANFSSATRWNLFQVAYSKVGFLNFCYYFINPELIDPTSPMGQMITAKDKLLDYYQQFDNPSQLLQAIVLDEPLFGYLKEENVIQQLSELIGSLNIPKINPGQAAALLKNLIEIRPRALEILSSKGNPLEQVGEIGLKIMPILDALKGLFEHFTHLSSLPIQRLLTSSNQPTKEYTIPSGKRTFSDGASLFKSFQDREGLGLYISLLYKSKLQETLNKLDLSNHTFITHQNDRLTVNSSTIFGNFDGFAFEGFSFENSRFANFHFKDVYFTNCNFSHTAFTEEIGFENVYMDGSTADTFKQAWQTCAGHPSYRLAIKGNIQIIPLDPQAKEILDSLFPLKVEVPTKTEEAEETSSRFSFLGTTFQKMGTAASWTAEYVGKQCHNFTSYYAGQNPAQNTQEEVKECETLESALKQIKEALETKIREVQTQHSEEMTDLQDQVKQAQKALEQFNSCLEKIEGERRAKEEIHRCQNVLLNHEKPQVKQYYQSVLTGLCTLLNTLSLLNNDYINLIQTVRGKANGLSNQVAKDKAVGEDPEKTKGFFRKAGRMLQTGMEHLLQPAELIIPILECIPKIPGIVPGAIGKIMQFSDQLKIEQTKHLFRGLTPKKLERLADELARKMTSSYLEQILLLTEKGAITFAESGVECISGSLLNDLIPEKYGLLIGGWLSLRQIEQKSQQKIPGTMLSIPLTKKTLPGIDPTKVYTAGKLYSRSGIAFINEKSTRLPQNGLFPINYGYFRISHEEEHYFFPNATPPKTTQPQAAPSLGSSAPDHMCSLLIDKVDGIKNRMYASESKYKQAEIRYQQSAQEYEQTQANLRKELDELEPLIQKHVKGQTVTLDDIKKTRQPLIPEMGLHNPTNSNSCYMNVAIQIIRLIPPICTRIREITDSQPIKNKDNATAHLLLPLLTGNKLQDLKDLKINIVEICNFRGLNNQQDAHEALQKILEALNWAPVPIRNFGAAEGVRRTLGNDVQGNVLTTVVIPEQKNPKESVLFQDVLDHYFSRESKQEAFMINDKTVYKWEKFHRIVGTPEYLIIQLNRFDKNGNKVLTPILFPGNGKRVNVGCTDSDNHFFTSSYEIIGYINHNGTTPRSGHYVAYVKRNDDWYICNDTKVCRQSPKREWNEGGRIYNTQNDAYVIILKKTT